MHSFIVYNINEQSKIVVDECYSPSPLKIRQSLDGTKSFICYVDEPSFLDILTTKEGPYEYGEMMSVLEHPEWKINS